MIRGNNTARVLKMARDLLLNRINLHTYIHKINLHTYLYTYIHTFYLLAKNVHLVKIIYS